MVDLVFDRVELLERYQAAYRREARNLANARLLWVETQAAADLATTAYVEACLQDWIHKADDLEPEKDHLLSKVEYLQWAMGVYRLRLSDLARAIVLVKAELLVKGVN